jgi:hypothetical protein
MNTNQNNSELHNRIALTSENKTTMAPALTPTEKRVVERLLIFSQQQADMAANADDIGIFHNGISYGYWASARAICEERRIPFDDQQRICGAEPPKPTKKGN